MKLSYDKCHSSCKTCSKLENKLENKLIKLYYKNNIIKIIILKLFF